MEGKDLQKHVDEFHPNFSCEGSVCSVHSPGPVADDETLAFILIHPNHYDPVRDVVTIEAFQELTRRDLSTLRSALATKDEAISTRDDLVARGQQKIPPKERMVNEVCTASVAEIRAQTDGERRLLGVYDTALEKVRSHASIFTRGDVFDYNLLRKKVRNRIHETFTKNRMPFNKFLDGLRA